MNTASVINIFYEEGIHNETEADMINSSNIDPPEELMIAINEQLSDEGKEMDKEDLRAFICMLNGDYEFINQDSFCRTLNTFTNIDGTIPNIFGGIDIADDHMSSISAISGAFFREKDSMFVEYWITRFEELKEKIFLQEDMEFIYQEIDEFSVDFYLTFCCNNPIQVNNEIISINALRGETVFFVQEFISHNIVLYLVSIYGENSQQNLEMEDPVTGEIVMIPVNLMCDELLESTNYTLSVIANKINKP